MFHSIQLGTRISLNGIPFKSLKIGPTFRNNCCIYTPRFRKTHPCLTLLQAWLLQCTSHQDSWQEPPKALEWKLWDADEGDEIWKYFSPILQTLLPTPQQKTPGQVTSGVYCCLFFLGFCRNRRPAVKFIKMANFKQIHNNDYVKEIIHYNKHSCVDSRLYSL